MATNADNLDHQEKAAQTLNRVREGMESHQQLPLVSQLVRLIKEISGEAEKMSIHDLVAAISAEPTTLARVMSAASTMVYNPGGDEIASVHAAVVAIGFEQVRRLAISILLLETAQSEFSAEANRELAGTALLSGLVADELARGSVPVDPDLAFICAVLRSYGRMLVATFMPEQYAALVSQNSEYEGDESFRSMFGLLPVDLGHEILASQQLPPNVLDSLVHPDEQTRKESVQSRSSALVLAAEFSLRFSETLQTPDLTNENFLSRLEELGREYGTAFALVEPELKDLLSRVNVRLSTFNAQAGHSIDSVVAFRRLYCLANSRPIPPVFKAKGKTSRPAPVSANHSAATEIPRRDELTLRAAKSRQTWLDSG